MASNIVLQQSLKTIYDAAHAQLITYDAVQAKQQELYPRCIAHNTPTPFLLDGMALCEQCHADHHDYIAQRLRGETRA